MRRLVATRRRFRAALGLCALGIGSYVVAAMALPLGADLARHVGWFTLAFVFYLAAVAAVLAADGRERGSVRMDLALIVGVALLLRLGLIFTTPSLSDDLFRYVWDGKVLNAGVNPYLYPPSAPELAHLRGPLWQGINHKEMPTPYPPLAEALFAAVWRLAPDSLAAMQGMAVAFDLGVVALLIPMLARFGLDPRRAVIYAWNPLVLVQFAHSGHYDAAMILPLLGAIYLLEAGKGWASGALLGVATLLKLIPAVAAPLFLRFWGVAGLAAMGTVGAAGLLPWLVAGPSGSGLLSEASDARFNDSLGYLLVKLLAPFVDDPEVAARAVAGGVLAIGCLLLAADLWRRGSGPREVLQGTYRALGLLLLLNAVVEPWYLTWMVPFLCFVLRSTDRGLPLPDPALGWLLLSGLVVLTDLTYLPGSGATTWIWIRAVEYGPLYGLMALAAWSRRGTVIAPPPALSRSHRGRKGQGDPAGLPGGSSLPGGDQHAKG